MWKDRVVVPLNKWIEIRNRSVIQSLGYFPDDFVEYPFFGHVSEQDTAVHEKINEWYPDYFALMGHNRSAGFGKTECKDCILNPDSRNYDIIGIKKVMLRDLQDYCKLGEDKKQDIDLNLPRYPCDVVNKFKCPFKSDKMMNDDMLIMLGNIWHIVYEAINIAYSLTYQNDCLFQVNFESGTVYKESSHGMKSYPCGNTIDVDLGELQVCSVPIRGIQDIYETLTNRELLDKLLHQHMPKSCPMEFKDIILDYFTDIKDMILIEELHDLQGRNLEEERKVKEYLTTAKLNLISVISVGVKVVTSIALLQYMDVCRPLESA